jgi:hypothetical protein
MQAGVRDECAAAGGKAEGPGPPRRELPLGRALFAGAGAPGKYGNTPQDTYVPGVEPFFASCPSPRGESRQFRFNTPRARHLQARSDRLGFFPRVGVQQFLDLIRDPL